MAHFVEAVCAPSFSARPRDWVDVSDADYWVFVADDSYVRIQRRTSYPATFAFTQDNVLIAGYGPTELADALLTTPLAKIDEAIFRNDEFLYIAIPSTKPAITIQTDAFNTVPLFVGVQSDRCVATNDFAATYERLNSSHCHIDLHTVAEFLAHKVVFERTFIQEIRLLHDRKRLQWIEGQASVQLPPDAAMKDNYLTRNGDARDFPRRFEQTLSRYWQRYVGPSGTTACDLSLGLDSSTIAAYLSYAGYSPTTLTSVFPGEFAQSQLAKLHGFLRKFPAEPITLPATEDLNYPWMDVLDGKIRRPYNHFHEQPYTDTFDRLYAAAANRGATALFMGFGGDELFYNLDLRRLMDYDYPDDADLAGRGLQPAFNYLQHHRRDSPQLPVPLIQPTALTMSYTLNSKYLKHDLWMIRPYADPDLYAYVQTLPLRYCVDKLLLRIYADARGLPRSISAPNRNEDFREVYTTTALRLRNEIMHMLETSVLAKQNLIEIAPLLAAYQRFVVHDSSDNATALLLMRILSAELNVRSLSSQSKMD